MSKENITFKKRLRNQKSMLRIRDMDKEYKTNHLKMVERSRKIKASRNIVLPPITSIVNRVNSTKKYRKNSYGSSISKDKENFHSKNL